MKRISAPGKTFDTRLIITSFLARMLHKVYPLRRFVRITRITGPAHNLLSLHLVVGPTDSEVVIEEFDLSEKIQLSAGDVLREVLAGVDEANRELKANYNVKHLRFAPSDSGPVSIYRTFAYKLVKHFAGNI